MSAEDRYRQFFADADTDNDGHLSVEELKQALRQRGYQGADTKIEAMFESFDDSGDRKISLDEYLKAMGSIPDKDHKTAAVYQVFRSFDKNGDGELDKSELDAVFKELGMNVSEDEIKKIISAADRDGSKTINYEEFMKEVF